MRLGAGAATAAAASALAACSSGASGPGPGGDGGPRDAVAEVRADAGDARAGGRDAGAPALRGVEVFDPPQPGTSAFAPIAQYLVSPDAGASAAIAAAVVQVDWSDFDLGGGVYDFGLADAALAPWIAAGKKVNVVLLSTTYGGSNCGAGGAGRTGSRGTSGIGNCAMPPWVWTALGPGDVVTCGTGTSAQQVPNFFASAFQDAYRAAIGKLVAYYGQNPSVGYLRIGLGKGGEINLPGGWDQPSTPCGAKYTTAWGATVGATASFTWNAYLKSMLEFEASLRSPKQLMVSITPVTTTGETGSVVPDFLAPIAAGLGIGFGNQGLQASDLTSFPTCSGDWCGLFAREPGVPHELQTYGASCAAGVGGCGAGTMSSSTGPLPPLLGFATSHGATLLEVYAQDWLLAYDPAAQGNAQYGAAYRQALEQAAAALR